MIISKEELHSFTCKVFEKIGCNAAHALLAADVLLKADLRGIDSHGVARLTGYVRLWEKQRINTSPQFKIEHETFTTTTLNADRALGLVSAPYAMDIAIEKAKTYGCGFTAINNSNHFGIAAFHAMKALPHDMIGIAMTNASPLVAPTYGKQRMLGTNPMCYVFPAGKHQPVVVDMATSAAANGKLEIAQRTGKEIPSGWVQTKDGAPTQDAHGLKAGGALLPLGSTIINGSHKGYALSSVVDIFCGVLSGANYGAWVPPFVAFLEPLANLPGAGLGHFVGAIRVDAFRPANEFKNNMDQWIASFKNSTPIDSKQPIIIPGEPEFEAERIRTKEGIPLHDDVVNDLKQLAQKFNLTF
jgi:LDH2 family malate/lactate/ureidoglycolate dehydrogenase